MSEIQLSIMAGAGGVAAGALLVFFCIAIPVWLANQKGRRR